MPRNSKGQFTKRRRSRARTNTNSAPRRRNKYRGAVNLKQLGLGYASASVLLGTVFNAPDPIGFVLGKHSKGYGGGGIFGESSGAYSGTSAISLREIFEFDKWKSAGSNMTLTKQIGENIQKNAVKGIMGMIAIKIADKAITKLGVSRSFNKSVRALGMGSLVKM